MLAALSITTVAHDVARSTRAQVVADSVALAATIRPDLAERVAKKNDAKIQVLDPNFDELGTICVEVWTNGANARSCAQLTTPTLDN